MRFTTVAGQAVILVDSVTWLDDRARACVVVTGSHGGVYSALAGAARAPRALLFNDAGVGKDSAGIAGLEALDRFGMTAATVDCWSARIGDAEDTLAAGVISHANDCASRRGIRPGITASQAVRMFVGAAMWQAPDTLPSYPEEKATVHDTGVPIYVIDSASLIDEHMSKGIVVAASHGGVVGGGALKHEVRAVFFNDAGIGKQEAGIGRLAVLDRQGIPASSVDYRSARIGDGQDTFGNGSVSRVNDAAAKAGVRPGNAVAHACAILADALRGGTDFTEGADRAWR